MDLLDIAQCKADLDFKPCQSSKDSLPSIAWNKYLITGFERTSGTVINLSAPLPNLLKDCHPSLTLPEIARFLEKLKTLKDDYWIVDEDEVLRKYSLINHPELHEIFSLIQLLPLELQNWISEKNMSPKELYPLRSILKRSPVTAIGFMFDLFNAFKVRKASRVQAARTVELSIEPFLAGQNIWPKTGISQDTWIHGLEKMRQPQNTTDDARSQAVQSLSWPSNVQARWVGEGEMSGVEVKFSVHNAAEFEKFVKDLELMSPQLKDKVWKSH